MFITARGIHGANRAIRFLSGRGFFSACCFIVGLGIIGFWLSRGVRAGNAEAMDLARNAAPVETSDANDLLVMRFDNSLNGEGGETPTTATGTSFQTGISNQGVLLPAPNQLLYSSTNNISATEGTFECWVKPTWNGNDNQDHFLLQYGNSSGEMVIGKDAANNLKVLLYRFAGIPDVGSAFNISSWQANQWHYLAFTWSNTSKRLQVYIDGVLKDEQSFTMNLQTLSNTAFQIGGNGAGEYTEAVIDNLRISNVVRSAQAISNRMLEGLTVSSWSLNPATSAVELWPTWYWWITPTITANTNVGMLSLPMLAASWASSNPAVALLEASSGRFKALAPGSAVQTGTLGGAQNSFTINVVTPVLPPVEETIDPFLATPASGYLHRMPVVIIRYFPTRDGVNLDPVATGTTSTLAALKSTVEQIERRHKFMLEEGSRFRGYGNAAAQPALGYQIIKTITVYEEVPPGFDAGGGAYFPDYNQILSRFGGENFVNNLGVKEFWIVQQHHGRVGINESNMSSPTTGDISNSFRTNGDQPIYNKTYVTYGINFTRSQAEATHNHGHQLESILSHVNQLRDGNTTLWWQQFARAANNPPARCGNTHFPPNATQDYDYTNLNLVASDILNWQPSGGPTTMVNANTWGNVPYAWPGGAAPSQEVESKWYIFWFQSMAGRDNAIPFNSNRLTNWWQFTADWDAAIQGGLGLHEPGGCNYALSAASQTVPLGGGTFTVNVTGGAGCKWIASSNEPWATVTAGSFGNGNGTVTVTVAAAGAVRNGTLAIANQLFTINQTGGGCPTIIVNPANATLPAATLGAAYSQTFSQTGGAGAINYTISVGVLPTGLALNPSTGVLAGAAAAAGAFSFTVRATDANNCAGERAYTLSVTAGNCVAVSISNALTVTQDGNLTVPVTVGDLTGLGVVAYDFTVMFDPSVLQPSIPVFDQAGTLSSGMTVTPNTSVAGRVTISAFGTTALSGAGTLLNLKLKAVGAIASCSDLAWVGFTFNEGTPCAAVSNGRACVVGGTISGAVSYCLNQARKVPGVLVTASTSQSSTTNSAGAYSLTGLSGGAVTVTPTKTGDVNGISSFDASLAAQRAAGIISFTSCQVSAADASSNGEVSSFDASLIAQYAAGISNAGSIAGTWKFAPPNRFYPSVTGDLTGEDYDAVLVGDVSGNWSAPGSGPLPAAVQVPVSLPNASGLNGGSVTVPIMVGSLTGQGLSSYDFELTFDQNVLQLQNPPVDAVGTLSSGMTITPNPTPGRLRISAFGVSPLSGIGTLLALKFNVVGAAGATTALNWQGFMFNEKIQTGLTNGNVAVCAAIDITPANLPAGTQGLPYNQTLTASGGAAAYNFSLSAGTLPGNLSLSTAGALSGTPAAAGAFSFTVRTTDTNGCFGEREYPLTINSPGGGGLQFFPLPQPVRLLETRAGFSGCTNLGVPINANGTFTLPARTSCAGIPANAAAVTGNITVVPVEPGFLTLFPSSATQPTVANSNFGAGEITNNVFTVGLGASDGAFKIFSSATTEVIVDVTGYYAPPGTGGLYFHPLSTPVRLLETRTGFMGCFAPGTPLTGTGNPDADPNLDLELQGRSPIVALCNSIPPSAQVLVGNATTVLPSGGGYLTIYPSGGNRPTVASSNYAGSDVINGPFAVKLGADGKFKVYTFATTHLVIDILGYYSEEATDTNGPGLLFHPLPAPVRLLETRPDFPGFPLIGCTRTNTPIQGNLATATHTQMAANFCGLPVTAQAVAGNVSVVNSTGAGFLTLFPGNLASAPLVATSNYPAPATFGYNRHYFVGLGPADGTFKVLTQFTTDLILDASGYFAP